MTLLLLGLCLGATVALARALALARQANDWTLSSTFVCLVAWAGNGPMALAAILGARTVTAAPPEGTFVQTPTWVGTFTLYSYLILFVVGIALATYRVRRVGSRASSLGLIALLLTSWGSFSAWFNGLPPLVLGSAALMGCLLATVLLPRGRGAMLGAGVAGVTLGILGTALAALRPATETLPCSETKCGPFGVLLIGTPGYENAFGLLLAVAIPFVWLGMRGRPKFVLTGFLAVMTVATGSRTASVAAVAAVAFLLLVRPRLESAPQKRRASLATLLGMVGVVAVVSVPYFVTDPLAFTGRAHLWRIAQEYTRSNQIVGNGIGAWQELVNEGILVRAAVYSTHNQWLDVFFIGGFVGLALFVALLWAFFVPRTAHRRVIAWCILIPVLYGGITERLWGVGAVDWLTFAFVAALLSTPAGEDGRSSPSTASDGSVAATGRLDGSGIRPGRHLAEANARAVGSKYGRGFVGAGRGTGAMNRRGQ